MKNFKESLSAKRIDRILLKKIYADEKESKEIMDLLIKEAVIDEAYEEDGFLIFRFSGEREFHYFRGFHIENGDVFIFFRPCNYDPEDYGHDSNVLWDWVYSYDLKK